MGALRMKAGAMRKKAEAMRIKAGGNEGQRNLQGRRK